MSVATPKPVDIAKLMAELEAVVDWFESDNVSIDQALAKYEEGLKLARELETALEGAKLKVEKLQQKFDES